VDLTPAERTLLHYMATRHPIIDPATASDETGLALATVKVALNHFTEAGLAKKVTRRLGPAQRPTGIYETTLLGTEVGGDLPTP
jgi:hypothetical protein